ncbi:Rv2231c family pyridoxal phosphate-dependent protein CobC [Micromonospora sp. RTGN7]|uniref:Rv2231c family pyridoxal phosphate-dependent protein CobC n=1 Tax=Micromonospora sp. RTGN7 TaxID=3016526 RepID=UPI0029FF1A18|nr:Rv2231c family pyridoxal phosphate-dependent protein CobC [Micromonospora sp. RTGN7]
MHRADAIAAPGRPKTHTAAPPVPEPAAAPLRHHGDSKLSAGLLDLTVDVSYLPRPEWLDRALHDGIANSDTYPEARAAHVAAARRYGRDESEILITAGAAEAFFLLARARPWRHPVVVHPRFAEPDIALSAAGHNATHVLCRAEDHFALDPDAVPEDADLVVVDNPNNPTGRLHAAATLRTLCRPGRVVVVDETFMDFVPGEPQTLTSHWLPGLVVVRSLTKLWSIPGIRAGLVVGDPAVVADFRAQQPPWSVNTLALHAVVTTTGPQAEADAEGRAALCVRQRRTLVDGLSELGLTVVESNAPFVLTRLGSGARARLREAGVAVRWTDTFPGLDDSWARIAVREPAATRRLLTTLGLAATWI